MKVVRSGLHGKEGCNELISSSGVDCTIRTVFSEDKPENISRTHFGLIEPNSLKPRAERLDGHSGCVVHFFLSSFPVGGRILTSFSGKCSCHHGSFSRILNLSFIPRVPIFSPYGFSCKLGRGMTVVYKKNIMQCVYFFTSESGITIPGVIRF